LGRKSDVLPLCFLTVSIGLAGCSQLNLRKGPDPILDATSVQIAAANQATIIDALARDAGVNDGAPDRYYRIAEAGFNYVDDQCRAYFDQIFFIDRERSQLKSGLAAASGMTAAILGVTNASTLTMSVVASAFGFTSAATDILAGTYLYSLPPATTQGFVNKLQAAFREGAAANRANINSPTTAYYAIQRYLSLCLPPTIEAEITKQVNSTVAVGVPVGRGSLVSVQTGSSVTLPRGPLVGPAPLTKEQVRAKRISDLGSPASNPRPIVEQANPARDLFIRRVKTALCVPETDASLSPATELAVKDYMRGMGLGAPKQIEPYFDPTLQPVLGKAINDVQDCRAQGFETPYEVGAFGVPADGRADNIKELQSKINDKLKANESNTTVKETGSFDTQTRDAIEELRQRRKLSPGRQIDLTLDKYLNSPNK
jgi:hypothetical protein